MKEKITIEVEVYMSLNFYLISKYKKKPIIIQAISGVRINDIREIIGLPSQDLLAFINQQPRNLNMQLYEDTKVSFFPILAGG